MGQLSRGDVDDCAEKYRDKKGRTSVKPTIGRERSMGRAGLKLDHPEITLFRDEKV